MHSIQRRYLGLMATPLLWDTDTLMGLTQFELPEASPFQPIAPIPDHIRLGKYVEVLLSNHLHHCPTVAVLGENIQIIYNKHTIGELDGLLHYKDTTIHLEIAYKFYLLDPTEGSTPLAQWIGPNRRDSLVQKLTKLKERQFPLLYNSYTKTYLDSLEIDPNTCVQRVHFKAQLFVLYGYTLTVTDINPNAVVGYYIHFHELAIFSKDKFYIPNKIDWLQQAHTQVPWINFTAFKAALALYFEKQSAPLVWVKKPSGDLQKVFVVWW